MMMKTIWVAAVMLLAGCSTSTEATVNEAQLTGRWEWQSATGGLAGRTITPATEGYTMQLQISADGGAQVFRNGTLTRTALWQVGPGSKTGSFAGRNVIRFAPPLFATDEMAFGSPDAAHLTLADGCCDGFTYTFGRSTSTP